MGDVLPSPVPPEEAIRFFRRKGFAPRFDWRDVWQEEHARMFTVAKATTLDVLGAIRTEVDRALADGVTFQDFKKTLTPRLQDLGWWGKKAVVDPVTGATKEAQLGSARRLRTILDTNLRTSYAAGDWERTQETKAAFPYLSYRAVLDGRTRPEHASWHGTTLPADHPWWDTHYPPNGWFCRCKARQVSERDLAGGRFRLSEPPKVEKRNYINKRTGEVTEVPKGIDPGFAYNVGKASLRAFVPGPTGAPPKTFPPGTSSPPLPPARRAAPERILPEGLSDREYAEAFLSEFGASVEREAIFRDVTGFPVVVGRELFLKQDGAPKSRKRDRGPLMKLLADALKAPDEIWWIWEKARDGTHLLRRRYIARWQVEGRDLPGLVIFEWGRDGWTGVTAFGPDQKAYVERQRGDLLHYRRKP